MKIQCFKMLSARIFQRIYTRQIALRRLAKSGNCVCSTTLDPRGGILGRCRLSVLTVLLAVVGLTIGLNMPAFAQSSNLVNVDIGYQLTFTGAAVHGQAGDLWNEFPFGYGTLSQIYLKNSIGSYTTASLVVTGVTGWYFDTNGGDPTSLKTEGLLGDYLDTRGSPIGITITGLETNAPYDLVIYSAGNQVNQYSYMHGAIEFQMSDAYRGDWSLGENYGENSNAISSTNGTLTVVLTNTTYMAFNGLQVIGNFFPATISPHLVNVDVYVTYTNSDAAVLGSAGDRWNELGFGSSTESLISMVDSQGNPTQVGITVSNITRWYTDPIGQDPCTLTTEGLLGDYLYADNTNMTVTLKGLIPNTSYDLIVYSAGNATNDIATMSGAINYTMSPCYRQAFQLGGCYAQNANAMSDANGTLTLTLSGTNTVAFDGLQIYGNLPGSQAAAVPVSLSVQAGPNNTVIFSWPSDATGYTLQSRTDLTSGGWSDAGATPVVVGNQYMVTNTMNTQAEFFRLKHQ